MTVHPEVLSRYMRMQRVHRSVLPAGEETSRRQVEAIDPHGILSLAMRVGEERAADLLRVRAAYATNERGD